MCVDGDLKLTFITKMVTPTEKLTRIKVNIKYFPKSGIANDVGGIISDNSKKKTPSDRTMEIESDIFSPESGGK